MANKKSLNRLTSEVFNTPHLITQSSLDTILTYLNLRNQGQLAVNDAEDKDEEDEDMHEAIGDVGLISMRGALTYRPVFGACGEVQGVSYVGLLNAVTELAEAGCSQILLEIDSPGGQAFSCFTTADRIRAICDEHGIELISYVDGNMASAAYAIGCVADRVIAHPDAAVGSIGCVVALRNPNGMLEKMGVKTKYITSTNGKVPFDDDGEFREEFIADIQEEVSRLGGMFAEHVSKYTGIPKEEVLSFDAKMFNSEKALQLNLINEVMTPQDFVATFAAKKKKKEQM